MNNQEALNKIKELKKDYLMRWGKEMDLSSIPDDIPQEELMKVLGLMVFTGYPFSIAYKEYKQKQ